MAVTCEREKERERVTDSRQSTQEAEYCNQFTSTNYGQLNAKLNAEP